MIVLKSRFRRSRFRYGRLRRIVALHREDRGTVAVVAALVLPVVVGGLGLGAESGYWYMMQRVLQHAADVSADAAGVRKRAGDAPPQIQQAALNVANATGFHPAIGTITVNNPPLAGAQMGQADSVEVILTHAYPPLLSGLFLKAPVTIRGRAVARVLPGSKGCVLALSPTASGAITASGSTSVALAGCDIASNSNAANSFLMSGSSASVRSGCVSAVGEAVTTSQLTLTQCSAVRSYAPVVRDPYASVAEPAVLGPCQNTNVGSPNGSVSLVPADAQPSGVKSMHFCKGVDFKGNVNFAPGVYIIEGGAMSINGGDPSASSSVNLSGSGVTFYFVNSGALAVNGKVTLQLSAPASGPFSGILFFGSRRSAGATQQVNGSAASVLQGAVYAPASQILFNGNSAATDGCTQIIGATVTFSGSSALSANCSKAGTRSIETGETVSIVE